MSEGVVPEETSGLARQDAAILVLATELSSVARVGVHKLHPESIRRLLSISVRLRGRLPLSDSITDCEALLRVAAQRAEARLGLRGDEAQKLLRVHLETHDMPQGHLEELVGTPPPAWRQDVLESVAAELWRLEAQPDVGVHAVEGEWPSGARTSNYSVERHQGDSSVQDTGSAFSYRRAQLVALGDDDAEAIQARMVDSVLATLAADKAARDRASEDLVVVETLGRLVDSEMVAAVRYRLILTQDTPFLPACDSERWAELPRHDVVEELLEGFVVLRRLNLALWRSVSHIETLRYGYVQGRGHETLALLFRLQAAHDHVYTRLAGDLEK